jgi:hypothetical protein
MGLQPLLAAPKGALMTHTFAKTQSWKDIVNVEEAYQLIDMGILLSWRDMRYIKKALSNQDQVEVIRHAALIFSERYTDRFASEILIETVLLWISSQVNEEMISVFVDEVMNDPDRLDMIHRFATLSISLEMTEERRKDGCFSIAVAIISEMGLRLHVGFRQDPEELAGAENILNSISTILYSVSNANSPRTRLHLVHYFGVMAGLGEPVEKLNRVMNRFGYTVLDTLFDQLFDKKTEAVALQFIVDNVPFLLLAGDQGQTIFSEILKNYMYKQPERFSLFLDIFSQSMAKREQVLVTDGEQVQITWLKHLAQLFYLANEIDHNFLAKDIILAICKFEHLPFGREILAKISKFDGVRPLFKEVANKLQGSSNKDSLFESYAQFRSKKRGRRPSFSKSDSINNLGKIVFLGESGRHKAS